MCAKQLVVKSRGGAGGFTEQSVLKSEQARENLAHVRHGLRARVSVCGGKPREYNRQRSTI